MRRSLWRQRMFSKKLLKIFIENMKINISIIKTKIIFIFAIFSFHQRNKISIITKWLAWLTFVNMKTTFPIFCVPFFGKIFIKYWKFIFTVKAIVELVCRLLYFWQKYLTFFFRGNNAAGSIAFRFYAIRNKKIFFVCIFCWYFYAQGTCLTKNLILNVNKCFIIKY